jgi:uncharacterized membrane protein YedE/YeeE
VTACGARCRVVALALAVASGALFGAGLLVAGMTDPDKVRGFLDLTAWDPSLAFVMGGALATYAALSRLILGRRRDPWFDVRFHVPSRRDLDLPLVTGAAIFGVGWGLAGACPGPGLVAAASGEGGAILFAVAMVAGMWIHERTVRS